MQDVSYEDLELARKVLGDHDHALKIGAIVSKRSRDGFAVLLIAKEFAILRQRAELAEARVKYFQDLAGKDDN